MKKDIWYYLALWRKCFPQHRKLLWRGSWLENDYCQDCRYCCGPQDSPIPYPMHLLPEQVGPETGKHLYLVDTHTAILDQRGCKALGSEGCSLERALRPVACGLFPLVPTKRGLFLYKNCPAVLLTPLVQWMDLAQEAGRFLCRIPREHLQHICLSIAPEKLAESHIFLHIAWGKNQHDHAQGKRFDNAKIR
ncbi:MAG: hypothetical protein IJA79_03215 [Desulfovibrio sp.]|nr:hypothetical protein [Desulfovibrio sp.]